MTVATPDFDRRAVDGRLKGASTPLLAGVLLAASSGLIYFAFAVFGMMLLAMPKGIALFWPAAGLSSGVLLLCGRWAAIPVAAGVFFASIAASMTVGRAIPPAICFGVANAVECLIVARIAEHFFGAPFRLTTLRRVLGLFLAAAVGTAVAAAIAATAIQVLAAPGSSWLNDWQLWFRSDFIGIIAVAPLIIGMRSLTARTTPIRDHLEGFAVLVVVTLVAYGVFAHPGPADNATTSWWLHFPTSTLFPPLLLLAVRSPIPYTAVASAVVSVIVVATTILNDGKIASLSDQLDVRVAFAQVAIFSLAVCSLSLAALIAERRAWEERQILLVSELDHRVKNCLALVQAVVERSREGMSSTDDFASRLNGRIRSLARTHSKLSRQKWHGVDLAALVKDELAPYQTHNRDLVSGPTVTLPPAAAQGFSMVLHELSTNAAKHGALSTPHGRVAVNWEIVDAESGGLLLRFSWVESGGPVPEENGREGFGTAAIRNMLSYEMGATVDLTFPPSGARCEISLKVPKA